MWVLTFSTILVAIQPVKFQRLACELFTWLRVDRATLPRTSPYAPSSSAHSVRARAGDLVAGVDVLSNGRGHLVYVKPWRS